MHPNGQACRPAMTGPCWVRHGEGVAAPLQESPWSSWLPPHADHLAFACCGSWSRTRRSPATSARRCSGKGKAWSNKNEKNQRSPSSVSACPSPTQHALAFHLHAYTVALTRQRLAALARVEPCWTDAVVVRDERLLAVGAVVARADRLAFCRILAKCIHKNLTGIMISLKKIPTK